MPFINVQLPWISIQAELTWSNLCSNSSDVFKYEGEIQKAVFDWSEGCAKMTYLASLVQYTFKNFFLSWSKHELFSMSCAPFSWSIEEDVSLFLTLCFPFSTGTLPPLVDPTEGGLFPDIQFWNQCADPVLAQDPFSSLMSALFCLPVQFLSSTKFFIPLVHLFYVVCVIQVCHLALSSLWICRLYASYTNS